MEEEPGGLSGGGCSSNKENSACQVNGFSKSTAAVSVATGGATCPAAACNIGWGCRTSVWQHECEAGIFIEPQFCAICLQHSRSAAVISMPNVRQAIAG